MYSKYYDQYGYIYQFVLENILKTDEDPEQILSIMDLFIGHAICEGASSRGYFTDLDISCIQNLGDNLSDIRKLVPRYGFFLRNTSYENYVANKADLFPLTVSDIFRNAFNKVNRILPLDTEGNGYIKKIYQMISNLVDEIADDSGFEKGAAKCLLGPLGLEKENNISDIVSSVRTESEKKSDKAMTGFARAEEYMADSTVMTGDKAYDEWNKKVTKEDEESKEDILAASLEKLKNMIGLAPVKNEIESLVYSYQADKMRREMGIEVNGDSSYHLVFSGNPGTGKTTVARIVADIYYALDIIPENKVIEASAEDMIAGYIGQTTLKTMELLEKARGGVLFIDEAYRLVNGGLSENYGQEAVDTLVKYMEDHRSELVIIAAGYPEDMKNFLAANAGLESRFKRTIYFPDYTPDEMLNIMDIFMNGWNIDEDIRIYIKEQLALETKKRGFANGRTVRNKVVAGMRAACDRRIGQMRKNGEQIKREQLITILMEDAVEAFSNDEQESSSMKIGFRV